MSSKVKDWTVLSMMEWATEYFEKKDIPDPRHSIEWLLAETLGIKRLDLYLKFDRPLSPDELDQLRPLVKRRAEHEPLQYITGYSDFMNAHISVNPSVLIPRIETEQLVELILEEQQSGKSLHVLDIGTGSGCIPIALKMEQPAWQLYAVDVSEDALELAKENARRNDVEIAFSSGDIFSPDSIEVGKPLDIIVSNPPYISPTEKEVLEPQVREYEPPLALFAENLEEMYQNIIRFAGDHLRGQGALYLELHEEHSEKILALFEKHKWKAQIRRDYDKKPRFIIAYRQ